MQPIDCETCYAALGNKDKNLHLNVSKETRKYIDELNRGGLTFPTFSSISYNVHIVSSMCVFQVTLKTNLSLYLTKNTHW